MFVIVGYRVVMRLHISIDDDVVRRLDEQVGARERSTFIERAVRRELDHLSRIEALDNAIGAVAGEHEWDDDPAEWVRSQRSDARRAG